MLDNVPISLLHSALLFGGVGQAKYLKSQTKGTPPGPTTQSFEPEDFPETAEKPAIGGFCGCVSVSAETVSGLNAIFGVLSLGRGISFPRCRSAGGKGLSAD
jgi:hypothetical protein